MFVEYHYLYRNLFDHAETSMPIAIYCSSSLSNTLKLCTYITRYWVGCGIV